MKFQDLEKETQTKIIDKMTRLYAYHIDKYLEQKADGYRTFIKDRWISEKLLDWELNETTLSKKITAFKRSDIELHLSGHKTYGLFAGVKYTKFITFDVDSASVDLSRSAALELINVLHTIFKISNEDIHVIFSGKKGYHVSLYFERPVKNEIAKEFYVEVMRYTDKPQEVNIEFRPTNKQGVKLPLGIHRTAAGSPRSWFIDKNTFRPIKSFEYILGIEPISNHSCLDYKSFKDEMPAPVVVAPINSVEHFQLSDYEKANLRGFSAALIKNGQLSQSGTRHNATLALAIHCRTSGYSIDSTVKLIMNILQNSPRRLIQLDPKNWQEETARIVNMCYEKGYSFKVNTDHIRIYKPEMERVMQFKNFKLKYFAFVMLMVGKSYGPIFYFTFNSTLAETDINSRHTISTYRQTLIDDGFINLINGGEIDKEESAVRSHRFFAKSLFELCHIPYTDLDPFIEITYALKIDSFKQSVYNFFTERELRKIVSKHEFYNYWRT